MIKLIATIDDINYELPQDITITQYAEVMRRMNMSETEIEKAADIISVLLDMPYQIIRELEPEMMVELSVFLLERINECNIEYQNTFKYKDVEYGGIDLTKMTFGEYIDLVSYIKNDIYIYRNIHKICSLIYRPILEKDGPNYTIKNYNIYDHEKQSELFKNLPAKYFFGALANIYNFLTQLKKDFEVLFGEEKLDRPDLKENKKEEEESNLPWYKMIMVLTADDFTKIDYVTARPLVECFNHLTYIAIKNEEMKQKQLEHQNKMNLMK